MKVSAAKSGAFVANVPAHIRAVLLFGPDAGLVRDHASTITSAIVEDPSDAFRITVLDPDTIVAAAGSLVDEVNALALGGGRRVVNIRGAGDTLATACTMALDHGQGDTLLVVEAADLPPRSKLRTVFEKSAAAAALPCYPASAQSLRALAASVFADHGLAGSPPVFDVIERHLGADHLVSRRELEKLAVYCAPTGQIDEVDATAVLANVAALSMDDLVNAVANGDINALDRHLTQLLQEKMAGVAIVRAVGRHFQRLWHVQAAINSGKSIDSAVSGLRPPVFWKFKDAFNRQLRRWPTHYLSAASQRLLEAELALKSTGAPEGPITERCLLSIAGIPRRN